MKHFSETEWTLFIKQQISETERMEMESHLLQCHICFGKYLKATEKSIKSNHTSSVSTPANFSDKIMKIITAEKKLQAKKKALRQKNNLITHYVAAACLTLYFTGSGILFLFTSSIPHVAAQAVNITKQTEEYFGHDWTERLIHTEVEFKLDLKFLDWSDDSGEEK